MDTRIDAADSVYKVVDKLFEIYDQRYSEASDIAIATKAKSLIYSKLLAAQSYSELSRNINQMLTVNGFKR